MGWYLAQQVQQTKTNKQVLLTSAKLIATLKSWICENIYYKIDFICTKFIKDSDCKWETVRGMESTPPLLPPQQTYAHPNFEEQIKTQS